MDDLIITRKAFKLCKKKHEKKKLKHVICVSNFVLAKLNKFYSKSYNDEKSLTRSQIDEIVAASYLHDILEDTNITKEDLKNKNFSSIIIDIVELLSHKKSDNYFQYIKKIKNSKNEFAILIKLEDLNCKIVNCKNKNKIVKYTFAEYFLKN